MQLFDSLFESARAILIRESQTAGGKARILRETSWSKNTLTSLISGNEPNDHTKRDAINLAFGNKDGLLVSLFAEKTHARLDEQQTLHEYIGKSRYVRKNSGGSIVCGSLIVDRFEGVVRFKSIPDLDRKGNKNPPDKPAHEGFVLRYGPRTVYLGLGSRYVRPIIAYNRDGPALTVSRGIVLTTDQIHLDPMAGVIFFAHESLPDHASFEEDYKANFDEYVRAVDTNDFVGLIKL